MTQKAVLITGASGLLGRALVDVFLENGVDVVGQYFSRRPPARDRCLWIQGDLSTASGIDRFLREHEASIVSCRYLINNWGPITYKDVRELNAADFMRDYFDNVAPAVEITNFLLRREYLESVVNIGFEFVGETRTYKKILSYAAAKNGLWLVTKAYAGAFHPVRFNMVSPVTIDGADLPSPNERRATPAAVAQKVLRVMTGFETGVNFVI